MRRSIATRSIHWLILASLCLVASGCSVSFSTYKTAYDEPTRAGLEGALERYEQAVAENDDKTFCSMTSRAMLNKFAATFQLYNVDCADVFAAVAKQEKGLSAAERGKIGRIEVDGESGSAVQTYENDGRKLRARLIFERRNGQWIYAETKPLDETAPRAPTEAYRAYTRAVGRGDGEAACSMITDRGKGLLAQAGATRAKSVTSCETAVPVLAPQVTSIPEPEVYGGDVRGDRAFLGVLQAYGRDQYLMRFIYMKKVDGRWMFDHSEDAGKNRRFPSGAQQS